MVGCGSGESCCDSAQVILTDKTRSQRDEQVGVSGYSNVIMCRGERQTCICKVQVKTGSKLDRGYVRSNMLLSVTLLNIMPSTTFSSLTRPCTTSSTLTMASRIPAIFDAEDPCSPLSVPNSQTALLLMDYQNVTVAAIGDEGTKAVSTAGMLQRWAAEIGILAIHCLVNTDGQMPRPSSKTAARFKVMQARLQEEPALGDEDEMLRKISANEETDARKPGFRSALQGPKLRGILAAAGIKSLILCGLSTSGCVLSTTSAATDAEYIVTVAKDACADPVPGLHDMLMKHVISGTAHVANGADLMETWKKRA